MHSELQISFKYLAIQSFLDFRFIPSLFLCFVDFIVGLKDLFDSLEVTTKLIHSSPLTNLYSNSFLFQKFIVKSHSLWKVQSPKLLLTGCLIHAIHEKVVVDS